MAEERIKRKGLWRAFGTSIKSKQEWIGVARKLGFSVTNPSGGSSHSAIRKSGFPLDDIDGLVVTLYEPLRKDTNEIIFKQLLDAGCSEDDIWKALGRLK
jgi:hypothetical protein